MTLRFKDPEDPDRIWHMKRPGDIGVKVDDDAGNIGCVLMVCRSSRTDDTDVWLLKRLRKGSEYTKRAKQTDYKGRVTEIIIDEKTVTINTTGGTVLIYRS